MVPVVTPGRNSLLQPQSTDQEMQWLPEVGRSLIQAEPPALRQFSPELCEMGRLCKTPPEEMCEAMFEDPPREPCVELCEDTPPWELCRESLPEPCEGLCEEMCKDPPPWKPCEGSFGSPMQGKARLPSIVVEPTEVGEVESGELRWPPDDFLLQEGEDELFTDEEEQAPGPGPPALESTLDEVLL
ncbi:LBH domain-containing protein 1 isoform X2 [Pelodiscus sinensis]|uniref:LBH domain-containing protein 1 isoform X2 n=1 Tax=Pelodiscus sinensis TaxID=13735 RepID=UPI000D723C13|nr:uncharacterized protein LOC106731638 isoform X2 [Pelodiscus sinensis]|eukprot:XP_025037969.1 uncharacterized protein LOC106731638 isoform X2 [Pelodiscus sinensis]